MALLKRIGESPRARAVVGFLAAEYLRLVWRTSEFVFEPPDIYERVAPETPVIVTMWHGQHFMTPFLKRPQFLAKVLVSRHRDGDINAIIAERLHVGTVRGSGDHARRFDRKGGVAAFKAMLNALEEGYNMALTADVPKVARVAGLGVVKLAQISGRPIYPVAMATSRRIELNNWDRSAVNLPFSRGAVVVGEPIRVPAQCDSEALEAARRAVEANLNAATERAYAIVDRRADDGRD
jgi:lysophospholipid acyltransferase (LPLAT)-like uncharacterized protein